MSSRTISFPKITGRYSLGDVNGTANQCRENTIQLFEVHRVLIVKASEDPSEAIEFRIGQWLWFHGATLVIVTQFKRR